MIKSWELFVCFLVIASKVKKKLVVVTERFFALQVGITASVYTYTSIGIA
jgi:hypothetical protein